MERQHGGVPAEIMSVVEKIANLLEPETIFMFSNKRGKAGKTAGFKLCVVAEHSDRAAAERRLYLAIDCEVPFDIVIYSPAEFEALRNSEGSFAQRIAESGVVLYGQKAF